MPTQAEKDNIIELYVGYFGRSPDPAGLQYWYDEFDDGMSLGQIAQSFSVQPEAVAKYPFLAAEDVASPTTFITVVYQNLFSRDPDPEGLAYYTEQLEGGREVGQVIVDIMSGATGDDAVELANKVEAAQYFASQAADAGILTFDDDDAAMAAASAALDGVDEDAATVDASKAATDAAIDALENGAIGTPQSLTSGTDNLSGTVGDDMFEAYQAQNTESGGGLSNTLSSADRVDGGAGDDSLYADLSVEFLGSNGFALTDIQPRLTSIETIDIEARDFAGGQNFSLGGSTADDISDGILNAINSVLDGIPDLSTIDDFIREADGNPFLPITVDAKHIVGHDVIGSHYSDGDLKIENLTTKETSDASSARNTAELTVKMAYTDNRNSDGDASDLHVLFDNDYLLAGEVSEGVAEFFLLDEKAELDRLQGETVEGRLDEIDKNGIRFSVDGEEVEVFFDPALIDISAPAGESVDTHDQFIAALQDPLRELIDAGTLPEGTKIERFDYTEVVTDGEGKTLNRTGLNDGRLSDLIPAIRVVVPNTTDVEALGYVAPDEITGAFDVFGEFRDEFEEEDLPVTINIDLEKAGRGGEGGNLIVGGKSANVPDGIEGGIEVFNVNVIGDSKLPSWIGALNSTLDALDTINVVTDPDFAGSGNVADLTIGEIGGAAFNNGGETDVRVFDATGFEGNFTGFANLDEMGNGAHNYLLGGGDDTLEIVFGSTDDGDSPFGGAAGDSLTIDTGAGDDVLIIDDARFVSNGGAQDRQADLEFLDIETGSGDDTVYYDSDNQNAGPTVGSTDTTTGDGAFISTSEGEDNIYMHNGESEFVELDIVDIGNADNFQLFEGSLQVTFAGVQSEWVDVGYDASTYTTSREDVREAILAAVEASPALSGMIEIVELADGSLQARSLVSGDAVALAVDIEGPVASTTAIDDGDLSDAVGGGDEPAIDPTGAAVTDEDGWDLLNNQSTLNQVSIGQLEDAWSAWYPDSTAFADTPDWSSDDPDFGGSGVNVGNANDILTAMDAIADDVLDIVGELDGPTGNNSDDNVINAGANDDLIVLSTEAVDDETDDTENGNGNTVEFTGTFGWDTIVNFTSDNPAAPVTASTPIGAADEFNDNDILDFTSYLDAAADGRGTSVGEQDLRVDEAVPFTFINVMTGAADASSGTEVDHNQIRLMDFSELWNDLFTDTDETAPSDFDSLTAADVDAWLEQQQLDDDLSVTEGDDTGVGNQFVVLIGKDGDIEIQEDGTVDDTDNVDTDHADNQFWAFRGEVTAIDEDDYDFDVSFLGGVDLAETDITGLSPDDFGVDLFM